MFCKTCGVQSFYQPRSNSDGYGNDIGNQKQSLDKLIIFLHSSKIGIMPHCIDSDTIVSIKEHFFDGMNWEKSIDEDKVIKSLSCEIKLPS